jgi:hypothetical protein
LPSRKSAVPRLSRMLVAYWWSSSSREVWNSCEDLYAAAAVRERDDDRECRVAVTVRGERRASRDCGFP